MELPRRTLKLIPLRLLVYVPVLIDFDMNLYIGVRQPDKTYLCVPVSRCDIEGYYKNTVRLSDMFRNAPYIYTGIGKDSNYVMLTGYTENPDLSQITRLESETWEDMDPYFKKLYMNLMKGLDKKDDRTLEFFYRNFNI